jgi:hypothetical protein
MTYLSRMHTFAWLRTVTTALYEVTALRFSAHTCDYKSAIPNRIWLKNVPLFLVPLMNLRAITNRITPFITSGCLLHAVKRA